LYSSILGPIESRDAAAIFTSFSKVNRARPITKGRLNKTNVLAIIPRQIALKKGSIRWVGLARNDLTSSTDIAGSHGREPADVRPHVDEDIAGIQQLSQEASLTGLEEPEVHCALGPVGELALQPPTVSEDRRHVTSRLRQPTLLPAEQKGVTH